MCAFIPASANCSGATPFLAALREQGQPGVRRACGRSLVLVERCEEEIREAHVEPLQEAAVRERVPTELAPDAFGHLAIEAGEAGDAVRARGRRLEATQPRDHLGNGRRRTRVHGRIRYAAGRPRAAHKLVPMQAAQPPAGDPDRPVNPYEAIVAEARALIAAGNEPDWRGLKARISASGRKDRAQERALQQLERLRAVRRARTLVDREPAPPPDAGRAPAPSRAFRTRPTITGNMDVRRGGDAGAATLSWDKAAGVTSWDVRVSRRPSARAAYAAEEERSLPASETTVALELQELPIRVHLLGRGSAGQLLQRALISGLTRDNWNERWQRRATAS